MRILFILLSFFLLSCNSRLIPGKYEYATGVITVDSNNNVKYIRSGESAAMMSSGKVIRKANNLSFLPDSTYFSRIRISDVYFDSSLKGYKRVILDSTDDNLGEFSFYMFDNNLNELHFDKKYTCLYNQNQFQVDRIVLISKIKDNRSAMKFAHDSLFSNALLYDEIDGLFPNQRKWNTINLKISIKTSLFKFTQLGDFILKRNQFIKKDWPVYKLHR